MARNSALKALVHLESQKQLVLHHLLEQHTASNIYPKFAVMPFPEQTQRTFLVLPDTTVPVQNDSWQTECIQQSVATIPHLAGLFSVLLCALKMAFCSLSSGHSSVCQIQELFLQTGSSGAGMAPIPEGHFAARNPLLWKQKEQFCALLLLLTLLYQPEPQRWGKQHHCLVSSGSCLGRKVKDKNW